VALDLRRQDVLLGRGTGSNEHQGNRVFRSLVQSKNKEHASCTTRHGKELLVMKILKEIHDNGGRFLKKLPNGTRAQGYHYEVADLDTAMEKTRQVFQYIRREQRDSMQVGETAAAAAGTNGSHSRDPTTHQSFSGLVAPQSGMISHQRGSFELDTHRLVASVHAMPMSIFHGREQALRHRALFDGVLLDPWLSSVPHSAFSSCDRARHILALTNLSDRCIGPCRWEQSRILQQEVQDSRLRALYSCVAQGLLPTSHHYPVPFECSEEEEAHLRLLSLADLSDRFGPFPRGEWQQPQQHVMSAANPHDIAMLGSSRVYMDQRQLMQLLTCLQERQTNSVVARLRDFQQ
jgi:hypothetical protein